MQKIKKKGTAAKKQSEQELMTAAHQASAFITAYRKQFTVAAAAIAIFLALLAGYSLVRSLQEQKAAPLVAVAYESYVPSGGAAADYNKALELFRGVQANYPHTLSGAIAQYYAANCLAALGRRDEAISEYQEFVKRHSGEAFLLGFVYQRLGYLYGDAGKQDDAIRSFEKAESLTGPGVATVELAKIYERSGKIVEAQNKWKLVSDKLANTNWGMEAMGKVQKISAPPQQAAPSSVAK